MLQKTLHRLQLNSHGHDVNGVITMQYVTCGCLGCTSGRPTVATFCKSVDPALAKAQPTIMLFAGRPKSMTLSAHAGFHHNAFRTNQARAEAQA